MIRRNLFNAAVGFGGFAVGMAVLAGITHLGSDTDGGEPVASSTAGAPSVNPCEEAFDHQQAATEFKADSTEAKTVGKAVVFSSLIGSGTLPDAVCFNTATEFYPSKKAPPPTD